jgi:mono/diheme cytochrome c family protein
MRRLIGMLLVLGLIGGAVFWGLTVPKVLSAADLPKHVPDVFKGELVFNAGGCASCHATPPAGACDGKAADKRQLGGGRCLKTPFGTFHAPNLSSDKTDGIGAWTDEQFATAMLKGVSPKGEHYYPSFPFTSYQRMKLEDVQDLRAYLMTLPAVAGKAPPHALPLPFQVRRGLGLWKLLFLDGKPYVPAPNATPDVVRGGYLVESMGHCGECHTPRNALGGAQRALHLAGGPAPEGPGWIPNITQAADGLASWSKEDIASALGTGLLPDGDSFGGSMVEVQENMARLPAADRLAIGAYLKSLPATANPKPPKK